MKKKYENLLEKNKKHVIQKPVRIPKTDKILDTGDVLFLKENNVNYCKTMELEIFNEENFDEAKRLIELYDLKYEIKNNNFYIKILNEKDKMNFEYVLKYFKSNKIFHDIQNVNEEVKLAQSVMIDGIIFEPGDVLIITDNSHKKNTLIKDKKNRYRTLKNIELPIKENEKITIKKDAKIELKKLSSEQIHKEKNSEKIFGKKTTEQKEIDKNREKLEKGFPKIENGKWNRYKWEKENV